MKQKQYRHKKTKEIYTLHHTTGDSERGFLYSYLEHDGKILAFGSKVLKETFEEIEDSSGGEL